MEYYQEKDPNKSEADVKSLYQKCAKKIRGSKECVGGAATQLIRKLKKKYGNGPPTKKRFVPQEGGGDRGSNGDGSSSSDEKSKPKSSEAKSQRTKASGSSGSPNLHLATKEQLQKELERRLDEERDAEVEAEAEDEEEADPTFKRWTPGPFPQPVRVPCQLRMNSQVLWALYFCRASFLSV